MTCASMVSRPNLVGLMVAPRIAHRARTRLYRTKEEPGEDGDQN